MGIWAGLSCCGAVFVFVVFVVQESSSMHCAKAEIAPAYHANPSPALASTRLLLTKGEAELTLHLGGISAGKLDDLLRLQNMDQADHDSQLELYLPRSCPFHLLSSSAEDSPLATICQH